MPCLKFAQTQWCIYFALSAINTWKNNFAFLNSGSFKFAYWSVTLGEKSWKWNYFNNFIDQSFASTHYNELINIRPYSIFNQWNTKLCQSNCIFRTGGGGGGKGFTLPKALHYRYFWSTIYYNHLCVLISGIDIIIHVIPSIKKVYKKNLSEYVLQVMFVFLYIGKELRVWSYKYHVIN